MTELDNVTKLRRDIIYITLLVGVFMELFGAWYLFEYLIRWL